MLYFDGVFGLVLLGLWLYCLFDVITTDSAACRNLPKLAWLFIVLLLPDLGSIAWLVAGHPWQHQPRPTGGSAVAGRYPEYHRPGRQVPANPDDDEAFLHSLRERAEQQRRDNQARREQELRAEQEERQRRQQPGQEG
jgi:Phospholipase_D-nuclease N-terminal